MKIIFDRKSKRWRFVNGRFAPKPELKSLKKDKRGRPLDSRGKLVPKVAIAGFGPRDKRKRKPVPAPPEPVQAPEKLPEAWEPVPVPIRPSKASLEHVGLETISRDDRFIYGSHLNHNPPEKALPDAFLSAFKAFAKKSGMELEDQTLYGVGVQIRPATYGTVAKADIDRIREIAGKGARVQIVNEGVGVESVRVFFNDKPQGIDQATDVIEQKQRAIQEIYDLLWELWGDAYWASVWESEDEMY